MRNRDGIGCLGASLTIIIGFGLGFGLQLAIYTGIVYGVERMTTWRCPDYWAGALLFWLVTLVLAGIFKARVRD